MQFKLMHQTQGQNDTC